MTAMRTLVRQNLGKFLADLELDFKRFFFVDSSSAYIVLGKILVMLLWHHLAFRYIQDGVQDGGQL